MEAAAEGGGNHGDAAGAGPPDTAASGLNLDKATGGTGDNSTTSLPEEGIDNDDGADSDDGKKSEAKAGEIDNGPGTDTLLRLLGSQHDSSLNSTASSGIQPPGTGSSWRSHISIDSNISIFTCSSSSVLPAEFKANMPLSLPSAADQKSSESEDSPMPPPPRPLHDLSNSQLADSIRRLLPGDTQAPGAALQASGSQQAAHLTPAIHKPSWQQENPETLKALEAASLLQSDQEPWLPLPGGFFGTASFRFGTPAAPLSSGTASANNAAAGVDDATGFDTAASCHRHGRAPAFFAAEEPAAAAVVRARAAVLAEAALARQAAAASPAAVSPLSPLSVATSSGGSFHSRITHDSQPNPVLAPVVVGTPASLRPVRVAGIGASPLMPAFSAGSTSGRRLAHHPLAADRQSPRGALDFPPSETSSDPFQPLECYEALSSDSLARADAASDDDPTVAAAPAVLRQPPDDTQAKGSLTQEPAKRVRSRAAAVRAAAARGAGPGLPPVLRRSGTSASTEGASDETLRLLPKTRVEAHATAALSAESRSGAPFWRTPAELGATPSERSIRRVGGGYDIPNLRAPGREDAALAVLRDRMRRRPENEEVDRWLCTSVKVDPEVEAAAMAAATGQGLAASQAPAAGTENRSPSP